MEALVLAPGMDRAAAATLEEAKGHLENPKSLVWLDYCGLKPEDHEFLVSQFGFHELALEDASRPDGQRPKVEEYDDHFFLVMHSLSAVGSGRSLELERHEIDLFVGKNYVVSVHRRELPELTTIWKDAQKRPGIMGLGSDRLAYHLLDAVVDRYVEIIDQAEEVLDVLEDAVMDPKAGQENVQDIFNFKRQLIHFRKTAGPLREAINELTSRDFPHIRTRTLPYLRDVYDHLIRLSDMIDSYRDILTGALDVHLSAVSNRLNDIMKRLTVVATIFMPLTFITGFWGMNFNDFMPLGSALWWWGSLAAMVAVTLWMMAYFWRKKWM